MLSCESIVYSLEKDYRNTIAKMPFFLISQDFLIFTDLNCQWKTYNFNQKLERVSSYWVFDDEDVASAIS